MNTTKKTRLLHRFAALLVLGGWVSLAGATDIGTAATSGSEAAKEAAAATAMPNAPTDAPPSDDACRDGACEAANTATPQPDATPGIDLLPKLSLPALLGTEVVEDQC